MAAKPSTKQPGSMSSALFGLPAAPKYPTPPSRPAKTESASKGTQIDAKPSPVLGKKG